MLGIVPSGTTRLFPVLGDPIAQVQSPGKVTQILAERGRNAIVVPFHTSSPDLPKLFDTLSAVHNVGGMLVTLPHKRPAFGLCATRTDRAEFVKAVNVVRRSGSGWYGDNTDGLGYLDGIEREGFFVAGRRALLVGCGGAGSAIALEIMERGATELAIHDVDAARRDEIIAKLVEKYPGKISAGDADPSGYDLVANATPLGMRPGDPFPLDVGKLQSWQFVACAITKPEVSRLIAAARERGCRTMTGLAMFDAQAETLVDFLLDHQR